MRKGDAATYKYGLSNGPALDLFAEKDRKRIATGIEMGNIAIYKITKNLGQRFGQIVYIGLMKKLQAEISLILKDLQSSGKTEISVLDMTGITLNEKAFALCRFFLRRRSDTA